MMYWQAYQDQPFIFISLPTKVNDTQVHKICRLKFIKSMGTIFLPKFCGCLTMNLFDWEYISASFSDLSESLSDVPYLPIQKVTSNYRVL